MKSIIFVYLPLSHKEKSLQEVFTRLKTGSEAFTHQKSLKHQNSSRSTNLVLSTSLFTTKGALTLSIYSSNFHVVIHFQRTYLVCSYPGKLLKNAPQHGMGMCKWDHVATRLYKSSATKKVLSRLTNCSN